MSQNSGFEALECLQSAKWGYLHAPRYHHGFLSRLYHFSERRHGL